MSDLLLIVDGDNLTHRAFHTTPKTVRGPKNEPINAITGFFSMLLGHITRESPTRVFVSWDTLGVETYRSKLWPGYQGGRYFDPEIVTQLNLLPTLCEAFGFGVGKQAGAEADDLIASAVKRATKLGWNCLILTTDKDSFQLVSETVTVLAPRRGNPIPERVGPTQVVEKFGVLPEQVPAFKALSGDSSDCIPGLKGVGPKSAASLLLKYGDLESVLAEWKNPQEVELARTFEKVATMIDDLDVSLPTTAPDWQTGVEALKLLGATGVAERFQKTLLGSTS